MSWPLSRDGALRAAMTSAQLALIALPWVFILVSVILGGWVSANLAMYFYEELSPGARETQLMRDTGIVFFCANVALLPIATMGWHMGKKKTAAVLFATWPLIVFLMFIGAVGAMVSTDEVRRVQYGSVAIQAEEAGQRVVQDRAELARLESDGPVRLVPEIDAAAAMIGGLDLNNLDIASRQTIVNAQQALQRLGLYDAAIDGDPGPATLAAFTAAGPALAAERARAERATDLRQSIAENSAIRSEIGAVDRPVHWMFELLAAAWAWLPFTGETAPQTMSVMFKVLKAIAIELIVSVVYVAVISIGLAAMMSTRQRLDAERAEADRVRREAEEQARRELQWEMERQNRSAPKPPPPIDIDDKPAPADLQTTLDDIRRSIQSGRGPQDGSGISANPVTVTEPVPPKKPAQADGEFTG